MHERPQKVCAIAGIMQKFVVSFLNSFGKADSCAQVRPGIPSSFTRPSLSRNVTYQNVVGHLFKN